MRCPLCLDDGVSEFHERVDKRYGVQTYRKCGVCSLISLAPECHLAPDDEKARYDLHRNDPGDEGYVRFLSALAVPLSKRLEPASHGLDFGCGPGPAMDAILGSSGHTVALFDPYYRPDRGLLDETYDFVTCTEVLEHLRDPRAELERIDGMLRSGGLFGAMTTLIERDEDFPDWWYRKDPTHICFYRRATFEWIAGWLGWRIVMHEGNVVIFAAR